VGGRRVASKQIHGTGQALRAGVGSTSGCWRSKGAVDVENSKEKRLKIVEFLEFVVSKKEPALGLLCVLGSPVAQRIDRGAC
jgi:hypothetical protein